MLDEAGVEYTISVPFERLPVLKQKVDDRKRWRRLDARWSFFETRWKSKTWDRILSHPGEIAIFIQADLSSEHTYPASA